MQGVAAKKENIGGNNFKEAQRNALDDKNFYIVNGGCAMSDSEWATKIKSDLTERELALLEKAKGIFTDNICYGENFPWYPYHCIKPFAYKKGDTGNEGIWNWDSTFHAIGALYFDDNLAKEQILGFVQYQCENGMLPDVMRATGKLEDVSSKPPVMAWAAGEVYKKTLDLEFVGEVYPRFKKNEEYWRNNRFYKGLFHYGADMSKAPFGELDLYIRWESGWDDSVRWDKPCSDYWPIDLNCFAVMMYRGLAVLADALGEKEDAEAYKEKEKTLTENINKYLWNDEIKCYVDMNRFSLEPSIVITPAAFTPLYIGIATKERAEYMSLFGKDKKKFYPGMPTVSYDDPEYSQKYWRGNTWLNVAYFAAKGLKNYGFDEIADGIRDTILGWVENDGDCVHENYNSTTGEGLFCPRFSWSCVFVIEFILNWGI